MQLTSTQLRRIYSIYKIDWSFTEIVYGNTWIFCFCLCFFVIVIGYQRSVCLQDLRDLLKNDYSLLVICQLFCGYHTSIRPYQSAIGRDAGSYRHRGWKLATSKTKLASIQMRNTRTKISNSLLLPIDMALKALLA